LTKVESKDPTTDFASLVSKLRNKRGVTPPTSDADGKRKFGSNGLRVDGRIFAMLSPEGRLIVKLPRVRVEALVASGEGVQYDPRHDGRLMKEWLVLKPTSKIEWFELAKEAMEFSSSKPKKSF